MCRVRVQHDQLGERVLLELGAEIHAGGARQIVEAVAVLQILELRLEHEVERRAEQAAVDHLAFGEAADPEVDGVEAGGGSESVDVIGRADHLVHAWQRQRRTGVCAGAVQEVEPVGGSSAGAEHDVGRCRALAGQRRRARDRGVRAVGRDEVDQRLRVLQLVHQVDPALIRFELAVVGRREELLARVVQGRNPGVPAAREIERGEIERQADEVVAQRVGDELVDLVAGLARDAAHDGAGRLLVGDAAGGIGERIEESGDQAELLIVGRVQRIGRYRIEKRVEPVDGLGQHRMAEAIDRVREFRDDRRIDGDVIAEWRQESVDVRLDRARELLEHQMLVLHLGAELGGLEQPLAVPIECCDLGRQRNVGDWGEQPLVQEGHRGCLRHRQRGA